VAAVAVSFLALILGASPASAHSVSGASASNYVTTLTSVRPAVPGIKLRIVEFGSRVELTNSTGTEVLVLGYQSEPYLRVGPQGVFENRRSPSTYINRSRQGGAVPGDADPTAPPSWVKVSDAPLVRWHDHRVHHMGTQDPPSVRRAPDRPHRITTWEVALQQGSTNITVGGTLDWVPGPSPTRWLLVALALAAVGAGAGFVGRRARGPVLAVLVAVLVVSDVVHSVGVGFVRAGTLGDKLGALLATSVYSIPIWLVGLAGVVMHLRRSRDADLATLFAGILVAVVGGLVDVGALSRSQVPFVWSTALVRWLVAAAIGLGAGLAIAAAVGLIRERREHAPQGA
jgi:hypothetical protein